MTTNILATVEACLSRIDNGMSSNTLKSNYDKMEMIIFSPKQLMKKSDTLFLIYSSFVKKTRN